MDYTDKVVWITGASSGIGEHLAYAFSNLGANLLLSSRNEEKLLRVQSNLKGKGKSEILPLDVSDHASLSSKTERAIQYFGKIDILVNNAGVSQRGSIENTSIEVEKRIFDINYFGNIGLTKAILPHMLSNKEGRLVVISSVVGKLGIPFRSSYAGSKHALHGWYDALRAEVSDRGIHVHIICPGYIQTDISIHALDPEGKPHGVMDPGQKNGMPATDCANKIIAAINKDKKEVFIGKESYFILLRKFFPGIYYRILRKMARKRSY